MASAVHQARVFSSGLQEHQEEKVIKFSLEVLLESNELQFVATEIANAAKKQLRGTWCCVVGQSFST